MRLFFVKTLFYSIITRMIQTIIISIFAILLLLLPLVFWMYIFLSQYDSGISRRQFIAWILSWGLITLMFSYPSTPILGSLLLSIFSALDAQYIIALWLRVGWVVILISVWIFIFSVLFKHSIYKFIQKYVSALLVYFIVILLGSVIIYLAGRYMPEGNPMIQVQYIRYAFISFWWIVWYYIIVSLLEEWIKYFWTHGVVRENKKILFIDFILVACAVALWFSFVENIVYTYSYASLLGVDYWLLQVIFFRSIFAMILHIVGVIFMASWFWYLLFSEYPALKRGKAFAICVSVSLISHTLFDVSLTYNYIGFIFLYVILIYLTLTYLLTHQEQWFVDSQ